MKKQTRINLLHTESSKGFGGQELRILLEMEALKNYGYDSVLVARENTPIVDEAKQRDLACYPISIRSNFDLTAIWKIIKIIKSHQIDIINCHGSKDSWVASIAGRFLGKKIIRARHVANPIKAFPNNLIYTKFCDKIMTTSESIKQGIVDKGVDAEKIYSIPTGIEVQKFQQQKDEHFRAENNIPENKKLIGQISVLRGDKGPDIFLQAANEVLKKRQDVFFILVGDGRMREKLEQLHNTLEHRDQILLLGYRRDIPNIYNQLDIKVLSALQPEGVPQALLQAHAAKVPIVASDLGGINEVAIHEQTALLTPAGDVQALADSIIRLLDNQALAEKLSQQGHQLLLEKYSIEKMLSSMDTLYGSLLKL